jgi:uncharacterized protein (UPF0333 family)
MAKRSRKARKTSKSVQPVPVASVAPVAEAAVEDIVSVDSNGADDYIDNYHYVYTDMRTMVIITLIMLVAMFGLTFII